jgi:MFS family permease
MADPGTAARVAAPATARRRVALFVLFFLPGVCISSWVTRTPAIRDLLGASTAEMGLVLFGLSAGSMAGILASGPLVTRLGTRPVVVAGMAAVIGSMPVIGIGAAAGLSAVVGAGLALFGLGMGGSEVAMNIEGADVERVLGRPVLPAMHGFFSLGTAVGASAGIVLTAVAFPVLWHLGAVGVLAVVAFAAAVRHLPAGTGRESRVPHAERAAARGPAPWRDRRLLLVGVVVLAMALAEGTANDWLPLLMVDGHGVDPALGSAAFAIFATAMTVGRFTGGPVVSRFGRATVVRASAVVGAAGLALVIFVDSPALAVAAVVLWGLGTALGFPLAISAAGDSGPDSAARVSFVATVGYVAFLVGPPVLGFLGESHGLRAAVTVVLALVVLAAVLAPAVQARPAR